MLSFVVCDDNKVVLDRLSKMLESLFIQHDLDAEISFQSLTAEGVLDFLEDHTANVLFLDIDLKSKISGLDVADIVRKKNKEIYIIFTSAHLEYILIAYKYKTFDFLPKPIAIDRLEDTLLRLVDDITTTSPKRKTFIRINNKNTIICQDNIRYIRKDGMKLVFYTDTRTYETYGSFKKLEEELPDNFVRCHKSYIANINKINNVDPNGNLITFEQNFDSTEDLKCYIGPKYKTKFMEDLNNYGYFTDRLDGTNY